MTFCLVGMQAIGMQYTCYIQVPGTTTQALLEASIEAAAQNGALNVRSLLQSAVVASGSG